MEKKKCYAKVSVLLILTMFFSIFPVSDVYAITTKEKLEQAQKEHQQTKEQLENTKENIGQLEDVKETLQDKLEQLNAELETAGEKLSQIEDDIEKKEAEITETQADLAEAKKTEETQYANMKKRLQNMYESKGSLSIEMLFSAGSYSGFINRDTYIQKMSEYDENMLKEYQTTKETIAQKEKDLQKERRELEKLRKAAQTEKERIDAYILQTSTSITGYKGEISKAQKKAEEMERQMKAEEQNIATLKKKLEEELALSKRAANSKWRSISEIKFEEGDRYLLANLIYCEAGGEPYEGQVAVGAVVINRVLSSVFPDTVVGVIYQKKQFSPVGSGRLALALANNKATPSCYQAADEAMSGKTNVGSCLFFRTPIPGLNGIRIGGHIFY